MAHLGGGDLDALVSGRWDQVDPRVVRRIDGVDALLSVAAQVRKDWVTAVASQMNVQQAMELNQAAESARELGDRMVNVGNWSKIQQAPLQMAQSAAQMNIQKSRLALVQSQNRLLKTLGQVGVYQTLAIPSKLQDLPKSILSEQEAQSKGKAFQEHSYYADRFVNRGNVFQAYAAYQGAFANANLANDVLKLHQFVTEETVLHYNGMLKSTWDVLAESQNQIQAAAAAVNAQRDFAIAKIDLEWVLLGGEPTGFITLGGGDAAPAAGQ
jgi:outer membrane protein TolC